MRGQEVVVDARVVVEALQLRGAGDPQQVLVAGLVLGQQQQVERALVQLRVAVRHAARRQVGLDADDGLDALLDGLGVELDDAMHRAVVGERNGRHRQLAGAPHQLLEIAEAVEQRVFGMTVQMNEGHATCAAGARITNRGAKRDYSTGAARAGRPPPAEA